MITGRLAFFTVDYLSKNLDGQGNRPSISSKRILILREVHKAMSQKEKSAMDRTEKFEDDLELLTSELNQDLQPREQASLNALKDRLLELHAMNVVKINHSVMELVCAKPLIRRGYEVQVEHELEPTLTCDLYATKGDGNHIIEIETGYIPPEHALDPSTYLLARIASKITRYSNHTGKFALGTPLHYILPIPELLLTTPRKRTSENFKTVKALCDLYYKNPPVTLDEVRNARLHSVYIIDVDNLTAEEIDPEGYIKSKPVLANNFTRIL